MPLDPVTKWTSESVVPPGLTNRVNCISITPSGPEKDNAKYTGALADTNIAIRALVNNFANWTTNDGPVIDILPTAYSPLVDCTVLSIVEINDHITTKIYPNPTQNLININTHQAIESLIVYDMLGKKVVPNSYSGKTLEYKLDVSKLIFGIYLLQIKTTNGIEIIKFCKK